MKLSKYLLKSLLISLGITFFLEAPKNPQEGIKESNMDICGYIQIGIVFLWLTFVGCLSTFVTIKQIPLNILCGVPIFIYLLIMLTEAMVMLIRKLMIYCKKK